MKRSVVLMHLERGGSVGPSYWRNLKPAAFKAFVDEIFQHYRQEGYPFYQYNSRTKQNLFSKLAQLHVEGLIRDNVIHQNFCAQGLAWSYFPHALMVQARTSFHSVNETFSDDELFRKALGNILAMLEKSKSTFSHRTFASMMKMARGTQGVSNFRPSAAKALYQRYAQDKVVWDMSCGFGGRLLGAMSAPVKKYIGTDPATLTMKGLLQMKAELGGYSPAVIELNKVGSEEFVPAEPVDFCFTSPPYFDIEKYSNEPTQSYVKFPNMESWLNVFVRKTAENCFKCLRRDGILVFNVSEALAQPFVKVCRDVGFKEIERLQLRLSGMPGAGKKAGVYKDSTFKHEPVLIFKKR